MDLPKELTDKTIQQFLHAGSVIRMNIVFADGEQKIKRLVIMTNVNTSSILALTTTTNVKAPRRYYRKDDVFIAGGSEKAFERDTYIQLNRIIEISTDNIKNEYHKHNASILSEISSVMLSIIYNKINDSDLIEQKHIKRIISEKIISA